MSTSTSRADAPPNHLLVESPMSEDVQVIDTATRKVVRNIPILEHSDDVMGSPDGSVFYVGVQDDMRSPFGYQTNVVVYQMGGYNYLDFVKVGIPLNFITWVAAVIAIQAYFPF